MTTSTDRPGGANDDFEARDSYEQILATVLGYCPESLDVYGETCILVGEPSGMTLPVVAIFSQAIPLARQPLDADAIRAVQARVDRVEERILGEAVRRVRCSIEHMVEVGHAIREAYTFRSLLALGYGIPQDRGIADLRMLHEGIISSFPDRSGVDVGRDDDLGF